MVSLVEGEGRRAQEARSENYLKTKEMDIERTVQRNITRFKHPVIPKTEVEEMTSSKEYKELEKSFEERKKFSFEDIQGILIKKHGSVQLSDLKKIDMLYKEGLLELNDTKLLDLVCNNIHKKERSLRKMCKNREECFEVYKYYPDIHYINVPFFANRYKQLKEKYDISEDLKALIMKELGDCSMDYLNKACEVYNKEVYENLFKSEEGKIEEVDLFYKRIFWMERFKDWGISPVKEGDKALCHDLIDMHRGGRVMVDSVKVKSILENRGQYEKLKEFCESNEIKLFLNPDKILYMLNLMDEGLDLEGKRDISICLLREVNVGERNKPRVKELLGLTNEQFIEIRKFLLEAKGRYGVTLKSIVEYIRAKREVPHLNLAVYKFILKNKSELKENEILGTRHMNALLSIPLEKKAFANSIIGGLELILDGGADEYAGAYIRFRLEQLLEGGPHVNINNLLNSSEGDILEMLEQIPSLSLMQFINDIEPLSEYYGGTEIFNEYDVFGGLKKELDESLGEEVLIGKEKKPSEYYGITDKLKYIEENILDSYVLLDGHIQFITRRLERELAGLEEGSKDYRILKDFIENRLPEFGTYENTRELDPTVKKQVYESLKTQGYLVGDPTSYDLPNLQEEDQLSEMVYNTF